jgi:hypothetical protein
MAPLKEKCGRKHKDTLEIGEIIAKKDLVFNFIQTVTNMKECGQWIESTDKAPIGEMKAGN